jgi:hypothetical protein
MIIKTERKETEVAMLIAIGVDGTITVTDTSGVPLPKKSCEEMEALIDSATKRIEKSFTASVHYLSVNPCFVCIKIDGSCHWIEIPCRLLEIILAKA